MRDALTTANWVVSDPRIGGLQWPSSEVAIRLFSSQLFRSDGRGFHPTPYPLICTVMHPAFPRIDRVNTAANNEVCKEHGGPAAVTGGRCPSGWPSRTKRAKSLVVSDGRVKSYCTGTCGKPGEDSPDREDGWRCLRLGASDLSIAQGTSYPGELPPEMARDGISSLPLVRVEHGQATPSVCWKSVCQGECTQFQGLSINFSSRKISSTAYVHGGTVKSQVAKIDLECL
jgi:hypothetical protein